MSDEDIDGPARRAAYGPGEEETRRDIRRYGLARCVYAAVLADVEGTAHDLGPRDVSEEEAAEVARLLVVAQWMDTEVLARALGIDVEAVVAEDDGALEETVANRISAARNALEREEQR